MSTVEVTDRPRAQEQAVQPAILVVAVAMAVWEQVEALVARAAGSMALSRCLLHWAVVEEELDHGVAAPQPPVDHPHGVDDPGPVFLFELGAVLE